MNVLITLITVIRYVSTPMDHIIAMQCNKGYRLGLDGHTCHSKLSSTCTGILNCGNLYDGQGCIVNHWTIVVYKYMYMFI